MALNIELFYIISRKLSLCGLFWTTLYMHTHMHTYIYMDACMHAYILSCMHIYMHKCIDAYIYIHTYIHVSLQGVCLSSQGFLSGGFLSERFCPDWFLRIPPSARIQILYIRYNRKLNFNFRFRMYDNFFKV